MLITHFARCRIFFRKYRLLPGESSIAMLTERRTVGKVNQKFISEPNRSFVTVSCRKFSLFSVCMLLQKSKIMDAFVLLDL